MPVSEVIQPDEVECRYEGNDYEDIDYKSIKKQTDDAVLFLIGEKDVWIPKSCIESVDNDRVFVVTWFAKKEGLF